MEGIFFYKQSCFNMLCLHSRHAKQAFIKTNHAFCSLSLFLSFSFSLSLSLTGAVEKQKLVYILNRDSAAKLTISSPLEAHKSHTIQYYITGVDVGFENPIFAAIELDYSEVDNDPTGQAFQEAQKHLTYYEVQTSELYWMSNLTLANTNNPYSWIWV